MKKRVARDYVSLHRIALPRANASEECVARESTNVDRHVSFINGVRETSWIARELVSMLCHGDYTNQGGGGGAVPFTRERTKSEECERA